MSFALHELRSYETFVGRDSHGLFQKLRRGGSPQQIHFQKKKNAFGRIRTKIRVLTASGLWIASARVAQGSVSPGVINNGVDQAPPRRGK